MAQPLGDHLLSNNEASKACGLSASLLRIWELRYNWPNPIRHANGYRAYPPQLIEELKLIAERHRAGIPVRELIREGLPVLPETKPKKPPRKLTLDYTRNLRCGHEGVPQQLRKELVQALETRRLGQVHELLQRACWLLRRDDEVCCCLVPIVAGLAELTKQKRPMPGNVAALAEGVVARCRQLRRQISVSGDRHLVVVARGANRPLAEVVGVLLALHGLAVTIAEVPQPDTDWLRIGSVGRAAAGRDPHYLGRVAALPEKHAWDLRQLLDSQRLPWQPVAA